MKLRKGVQIYSEIETISNQIEINNGVTKAISNNQITYLKNAYIPKKTWRNITKSEKILLTTSNHYLEKYKSIFIGELPLNLKNILSLLKLQNCKTLAQVYPKIREKEETLKLVNKNINKFLSTHSMDHEHKFHRLTRSMPNRDTITCHYINNKFFYPGLHIDKSCFFTPFTAYKSGNRVSINLSKESRYFIYINLTLQQIAYMLRNNNQKLYKSMNVNNIVELFFLCYPNYPVIKVEVKPYQYYIAPTDNIIHDASTLNNKNIDITLVYTGNFKNKKY